MAGSVGIVDFGGQYTDLIRRTVEELQYAFEVVDYETFNPDGYDAVIFSGGPHSVTESPYPGEDIDIDELPPTLGICYGHQLLAEKLGGTVERHHGEQYGFERVEITEDDGIFTDVAYDHDAQHGEIVAIMSHGDTVTDLPPDTMETAVSGFWWYDEPVNAGFRTNDGRFWGVQFHPETDYDYGPEIIDAFLQRVAGLTLADGFDETYPHTSEPAN